MSDRSVRFASPTRRPTVTLSMLLAAAGIALAASPALSQGAMTPGAGAMTPQPRVAPAPQAPAAPQAPLTVAPNPAVAAPGPTGGPQKTLRLINNSETDTATVEQNANKGPNAKPGTTGSKQGFVNIDSSNRDHIDQDAQTDIKKGLTTSSGPVVPQRIAGTPLSSVPIGLEGDPGSLVAGKGTTDAGGNVTFKDLKPGNYKARLPNSGSQGGTVSMTTFVNGKLASRTEFPVGSSVGTFAVANARDTITLKFESNLNSTPVNGIGGTGGGRYTFKPGQQ